MASRLLLGTLGAIVGAAVGAVAWAAITAATNFQIGYMALGVGLLAGYGMRLLGGGRDRADGIIAAIVALLGCVAGNVLTAIVVVAQHGHYPYLAVLMAVLSKPAVVGEILQQGFNVLDLPFYAIAIYAGYRTAMKPRVETATAVPEPER
jgi:hypothetical protein